MSYYLCGYMSSLQKNEEEEEQKKTNNLGLPAVKLPPLFGHTFVPATF